MSERPTSLRIAREETIDALCRRFAEDALSLGELERRLDRARAAESRAELDALLADLEAPAAVPPAVAEERAPAVVRTHVPGDRPAPGVREAGHVAIAILGGTRRTGRWAPPASMVAGAIMGGVELDFREAVLRPGVTEVNCFAFWGGVDITVPPDVHVETQGFALMGGFDHLSELGSEPAPDAPVIRVTGFAFMGGVSIKVRERGERLAPASEGPSRLEARLDRRLARKEERIERLRQRHQRRRGGR